MSWIYDDTRGQDRHAWSGDSEQAIQNAWEIYNYFFENDLMSLEAVCGLVGNICAESHINPWQEQVGGTGFGLIQWTPPTALTDVFQEELPLGSAQCSLIYNEIMDNRVWGEGARWIPTSTYPYTGQEFCRLGSIEIATRAYFAERERGTWSDSRITWANYYWEVFTGQPPVPPTPPTPSTSAGMSLYFYMGRRFKRKKGLL